MDITTLPDSEKAQSKPESKEMGASASDMGKKRVRFNEKLEEVRFFTADPRIEPIKAPIDSAAAPWLTDSDKVEIKKVIELFEKALIPGLAPTSVEDFSKKDEEARELISRNIDRRIIDVDFREGDKEISEYNRVNATLLYRAINLGYFKTAQMLLEKGANPLIPGVYSEYSSDHVGPYHSLMMQLNSTKYYHLYQRYYEQFRSKGGVSLEDVLNPNQSLVKEYEDAAKKIITSLKGVDVIAIDFDRAINRVDLMFFRAFALEAKKQDKDLHIMSDLGPMEIKDIMSRAGLNVDKLAKKCHYTKYNTVAKILSDIRDEWKGDGDKMSLFYIGSGAANLQVKIDKLNLEQATDNKKSIVLKNSDNAKVMEILDNIAIEEPLGLTAKKASDIAEVIGGRNRVKAVAASFPTLSSVPEMGPPVLTAAQEKNLADRLLALGLPPLDLEDESISQSQPRNIIAQSSIKPLDKSSSIDKVRK